MRGVWQLRAARQLVLGLLPMVVIGIVLLVVLGVRGSGTGARLSEASARVDGVVQKIDSQGDPRWATIAWTDRAGQRHISRIGFESGSHPVAGATVRIRYVPGDPDRAYADGDITFARANNLVGGVLDVSLALLVVVVLTAVRIGRRVLVARRPGTTVKLSRVRTRFGLIQRSWLVAAVGNRERWLPVYWDPVLTGLLADTPCTVHGNLDAGGPVMIDIDGHRVWSSGRVRGTMPRGRQTANAGTYSKKSVRTDGPPVSLARQSLGDGALVILAPFLGILWAYINDLGAAGFGIATAVLAGVLFWLPGYYASDPT